MSLITRSYVHPHGIPSFLSCFREEFIIEITKRNVPFLVDLLQKSLKVVVEPPSKLKMVLQSTLMNLTCQTFNESEHPDYPSLIFLLSFFHGVLLDRRKFGKIGWSSLYDFNDSDCNFFSILKTRRENLFFF